MLRTRVAGVFLFLPLLAKLGFDRLVTKARYPNSAMVPHLDCLASEVRLNVDLDAALTVIANDCYRWLASRPRGYGKAAPKQLYRRFVETGGTILVQEDRIRVTLERRSHNPILREAGLDREQTPIPWLGNRCLDVAFR
jgi:hypothetical protein